MLATPLLAAILRARGVAAEPGQLGGGLRFGSPAHGHAALEDGVSLSYQKFVALGEYAFRPSGDAIRVVKFA
jgi:hypothetical protein